MTQIKTLLAFLLLQLCVVSTVQAQAVDENELVGVLSYMKKAMMFSLKLPQEKVYLHFDNTGYFKGETIWFTAYVVRADKTTPTDLSKVLYVELINPSGDIVETRKLPVLDGVAKGDIRLDSIFGSGFYEVRAYTRYMTNWGNGGIFSRVFPIFERPKVEGDYSKMQIATLSHKKRLPNIRTTDSGDGTDKGVSDKRFNVHFYPEGGHLVNGLTSRVAFVVTDNTGTYKDVGGSLLDENKQPVFAVTTGMGGRGLFEVTPDGKAKYLRLSEKNGKSHDYVLPSAEEQGIVMHLNMMLKDKIVASLYASPAMEGKLLGYALMHNGRILRVDTMMCKSLSVLSFDRETMPAGVSQLTVFTSDGHIQAERQFFICPASNEADTIRVVSRTKYPKPCGKVILDLKAQPNSSISFSAMDAATMTNGREGNALTWMLLSSDIKGYIEDPEYYFESDDKIHRYNADLLMMVQGWRRYDWSLMAEAVESNEGYSLYDSETSLFKQPIEDKLYLFGQLKQKKQKYGVGGVYLEAHLYNRSGQVLKGTAKTDSVGNYAFKLPDMDGEWKLLLNTGVEDNEGYWKDVDYNVCINRHFSPARRMLTPNETRTLDLLPANLFNDEASKKASIEDNVYVPIQKREHVLPTVIVKAHKRIFDGARAAWESETNAQKYAAMYYNADVDADKFADEGVTVPTLYQWLTMRNPFFSGRDIDNFDNPSDVAAAIDTEVAQSRTASLGDIVGDMANEMDVIQESQMMTTQDVGLNGENLDANIFESTDRQHRIMEDGLGYKNRPIVWILNNTYGAITHLGVRGELSQFVVLQRCVEDMPIFIDEVKSVYVSENPYAYRPYLMCSDLEGLSPVTVFVFTHYKMNYKVKGFRSTFFQGYNVPSTFEMEDYSVLPPMEDFRRTIYWNPDVKTDSKGNARVEFWNNSSCHEMHVSAEGMTPSGRFLINE